MLLEARQAGELVEEDSDENVGDSESSGAELRDLDIRESEEEDDEE
jgi:hypothetical protein